MRKIVANILMIVSILCVMSGCSQETAKDLQEQAEDIVGSGRPGRKYC